MFILGICGSPRNGNIQAMIEKVLEGAKQTGAETELILLRELNIQHCDGCGSCENTHECRIQDDMQELYEKIFNTDILILGSPNYFNNVSGLMKDFIDRMCPYWEDKRLRDKKAVMVGVGSDNLEELELSCVTTMKEFCNICNLKITGSIKAQAHKPREILNNTKIMQECFELGKKIVIGN